MRSIVRTEHEILAWLKANGARRLERVRLRDNRSTIWSLTKGGTVLNLHKAFGDAPPALLRQFVVIARSGHRHSSAFAAAAAEVRSWPPLERALRSARLRRAPRKGRVMRGDGPCCGSPEQRVYLQKLYRYLNVTRFDGLLPSRVYLRFSNRMKSRLGQMVPGVRNGQRAVIEIALNVDLMLSGNGRMRLDTMVHEMAHAADYLFNGNVGHGQSWKDWAEYSGCDAAACTHGRIRRRRRGLKTVDRVPSLPKAAREIAAA